MMKFILSTALLGFVLCDLDTKIYYTPDCTGTMRAEHKLKTDGTCYNATHHEHDHYMTAKCTDKEAIIFVWKDDKCTVEDHNHTNPIGSCTKMPHRGGGSILSTCPKFNEENIFSSWMQEHSKKYESQEETVRRFNIFKTNLGWINKRNTELEHMQVGLNEFADMTEAEFAGIYLHGINLATYNESIVKYTEFTNNPDHVTGKCATAVRNQGQCGSCWAFSASGSAEGLLCLQGDEENAYGHVSPQELVDCCCSGCNGGWPHTALDYYKSHGYCKDGAYPYTARKGSCQSSKCSGGKGINGHVSVQEPNLVQAISGNMLSICIDAGGLDFMFYRSGMYGQDQVTCSRHSVNHAVLAVGGSSSSYHVKNSWGASWGSGGYFDMPANKNCLGVNNQASVYPRA